MTGTPGKPSTRSTLFREIRDLLDADAAVRVSSGQPPVDVLALNMLNLHMRPFQQ